MNPCNKVNYFSATSTEEIFVWFPRYPIHFIVKKIPDIYNGSCSTGVTDCYIFKSRLQEYAQKVGFSTPVYYTIKEGPSHEPIFKSTVVVNEVKYESLPGFFNRKVAEQSAAEVALLELEKLGKMTQFMPTIVSVGDCSKFLFFLRQLRNF